MATPEEDYYIPYYATAEAITNASDAPKVYLLQHLKPDASPEDILSFKDYTTGVRLDGIDLGIELRYEDLLKAIDAYRLGYQEGYQQGRAESS